jgi:hypothetical protein
MQTFLPYPSFVQSAACLDRARLGKQRVEAMQILRALHGQSTGWVNHPATRMWRGHEEALILYGWSVVREWTDRGYKNSITDFNPDERGVIRMPPWLGRLDFHASHRSNLLRKDPKHYSQFYWTEPDNLPYIWPV